MKKYGIGKRILSLLLAAVLVLSAVPTSVFAAGVTGALVEDKDNAGLLNGIDAVDSISWPIKIYDYLNDGMLFEYSAAGNTDQYVSGEFMKNSLYAGGELMPDQDVIGNDYTVNGGKYLKAGANASDTSYGIDSDNGRPLATTYNTVDWGGYNKKTFTDWWKSTTYSPFETADSILQMGKSDPGAFKYMHLELQSGKTTKPMPISGFYYDSANWSTIPKKENLQYAVIVYRTDINNPTITLGMATDQISDKHYLPALSGSVNYCNYWNAASEDLTSASATRWNYEIIDMNTGELAEKWEVFSTVSTVIFDIDSNDMTEANFFDISHIAYFSTEAQAELYGKDAAKFSNDPGEYLADQVETTTPYVSDTPSAPAPESSVFGAYKLNFANGSAFSDTTYTSWGAMASNPSASPNYAVLSGDDDTTNVDEVGLLTGVSAPGISKATVRYVTIVYRTRNLAEDAQIGLWARGYQSNGTTATAAGYKTGGVLSKMLTLPQSVNNEWISFTYDLSWIDLVDKDTSGKGYYANYLNTITEIGAYLPMKGSNQGLDIAYIDYHSSAAAAAAFAEDAVIYMNNNMTTNAKPSLGNTTYGTNLVDNAINTTGAAINAGRWSHASYDKLTAVRYTSTNKAYVNLSDRTYTDTTNDWISIYADGGEGLTKTNASFITIVYRTHNLTSGAEMFVQGLTGTPRNYFNTGSSTTTQNSSAGYASTKVELPQSETTWVYYTYDMSLLNVDSYYRSCTKLTNLWIVLPGFTDITQSIDIAYIDFYSTKSAADTFGAKAAAYMNNGAVEGTVATQTTTAPKHWNMGSNAGFTMLYPANGGGWAYNGTSGRGDSNAWANGYFDYQIGYYLGGTAYSKWNTVNRKNAELKGYTVSDSIFLLNGYTGSYDVSTLNGTGDYNIGYTLKNTAVSGTYTVGLLESGLLTVTDKDGKSYKALQYKNDTIDYIGQLLERTLTIPEKDIWGNYNYNFVKGTKSSLYAFTYNEDNGTVTAGIDIGEDTLATKVDLATALRKRLGITFRSDMNKAYTYPERGYATDLDQIVETKADGTTVTKRQKLIGTFEDCLPYIDSCAAAAYYLLHNLFVDNSYNQVQNDYNYLVLSKATLTEKDENDEYKTAFVFDAGFTTGDPNSKSNTDDYLNSSLKGVVYDTEKGTISLRADVQSKDWVYYGAGDTTRFPFLPVTASTGDFAGESDTYIAEGTTNTVGIKNVGYTGNNFLYVMQANGEFVFHADDNLFFDFAGDDDVYLFINGELVLDIGAAHSITTVKFNMNDYVDAADTALKALPGYEKGMSDSEFQALLDASSLTAEKKAEYTRWHKLNLVDGQSYAIDFYYMERHGTGANMRVATNIVMTDPAMKTDKKAYQNGAEIPYGGIADKTQKIEYSFSVTNEGNNKLYNLAFADYNVGLTLDPTDGLTLLDMDPNTDGTQNYVTNASGTALTAADLVVTLTGEKDGEPYSLDITFDGANPNEELRAFLRNMTSDDGTESGETGGDNSGSGLWIGSTLTIRGIYYTMTTDQINAQVFNNTVFVNANPAENSQTIVKGEATHKVRVLDNALTIYQWAGHEIFISRSELVSLHGTGFKNTNDPSDTNSYGADAIVYDTCRSDGSSYSYTGVTVKENYTQLFINYTTPGTRTIYLKVGKQDGNGFGDCNNDGTVTSDDYLSIVPLVIHVADVKDDVIVLDYGLKVNLTDTNGIKANDHLSFSNTVYSIMRVTTSTADVGYLTFDANNGTESHDWKNINRIKFPATSTLQAADGDFSIIGADTYTTDDQLIYTPDTFMDELSTMYVAVTLHKDNATPSAVGPRNTAANGYSVSIDKEVQMYQKVTVLPANVVYYEDDFPAIEYAHESEDDDLTSANTFTPVGSSSNISQSVNQNTPYGSDPIYQENTNTAQSGGSLTTVTINDSNPFARFKFKGTGFEIISRTPAANSGTMEVVVYADADNNGTADGDAIKRIPVITEFDNGANEGSEVIYQVPVIRVDDLNLGHYIVEIAGVPKRSETADLTAVDISTAYKNGGITDAVLDSWLNSNPPKLTQDQYNELKALSVDGTARMKRAIEMITPTVVTSYLYIDGIRIYKPLGATNGNYNTKENGAVFYELRDLILNRQVAFVTYENEVSTSTDGTTEEAVKAISTGYSTWVENRNGTNFAGTTYAHNRVNSLTDYLVSGPNNEVYMKWSSNSGIKHAMVFYVSEDEGSNVTHSLQVGFRYVDQQLFNPTRYGNNTYSNCKLRYAVKSGGDLGTLKAIKTVNTSTEQYYTIDYTKCPIVTFEGDSKTYYEVVLVATNSVGSFSSLKCTGLTLKQDNQYEGDEVLQWKYVNGVLTLVNPATGQADSGTGFSRRYNYLFELMETDLSEDYENIEPVVKPNLTLEYPSLNFQDEVYYNVNYSVDDLTNVVEMGLITFNEALTDGTIDNALEVIPGFTANGDYYMSHTNGIPAKNMGDTLYFKVYAKLSDGTYAYSEVKGYSAVKFATGILEGDYPQKTKSLMVAMLNYGAAAQIQFNHNTDNLMNAGLTDEQKAYVEAYSDNMVSGVPTVDSVKAGEFVATATGYGEGYPSVAFGGAFAINYYFTVTGTPDGDVTLYYWRAADFDAAEVLTIENATGTVVMDATTSGTYHGSVTGIAAKEVDEIIYVAGVYESDGVRYCTGVIAYSLSAYCKGMSGSSDISANAKALAEQTAVYGYYAKQYFAQST